MLSPPDYLVLSLCLGSAATWVVTVWRWRRARRRKPDTPSSDAPEATIAAIRPPRPIPVGAILLAGLWILQSLMQTVATVSADSSSGESTFDPDRVLTSIQQSLLLQGAIVGALWLTLFWMPATPQPDHRRLPLGKGLCHGGVCIMKAWLPVFLALVASEPLRQADDAHSVLRLLTERPDPAIYVWSTLSAVVMAPIFEELIFRVILQDWLRGIIGRWGAILLTALAFAAVHRFPDSLALVPLALLLGWTFDRYGSYVAIVTAHAAFNAVMLVLHAISATIPGS